MIRSARAGLPIRGHRDRPFRRKAAVLVVLGLLYLVSPARLHGQLLNFRSFGHDDGLPQVQIQALLQDAHGFLWMGSYGGLSRFDGVHFTTLTSALGLSSNSVVDLALDPAGELVVGTSGGGVCFRTGGGFDCVEKADHLAGNDVTSVLAEPNGFVWVGTTRGLSLLRHRRVVRTYTSAQGLPASNVTRVIRDRQGRLWVSTSRGPARLERGRFVPDRAGMPGTAPVTVLGSTTRGLVLTDHKGVYLSSRGHVRKLAASTQRFTDMGHDVAEGPDGTIWIATYEGVLRVRGGSVDWVTTANGLVDDRVDRVIVDHEGDVWFGTEFGVSELIPGPFEFFTPRSGLPDKFVSYILQDRRGRIWVTTQRGPAIWDGHRFRAFRLPPPATGVAAYPMAQAPSGGLLIGTLGAGLAWVRPSGTRVYGSRSGLPNLTVLSLLEDSTGVWIGTQGGLARWEYGRITVPHDSVLSRAAVFSMAEDGGGRLWIGLQGGGLLVWDGKHLVHEGKAQGLTNQTVWVMAHGPHGELWMGTNGDGAFRIHGHRITRLTTANGLANDFVWQVQPDRNGDVWFFTNRGLDRLHDGTIRHYGAGDGLVDQEGSSAASFEDASGDLWFGTGTGVYRYDPAQVESAERIPPVYVEGLSAGGLSFPLSGAMLPPRPSALEVTFSSPTYRDRSAVRFLYRLGRHTAWSAPQAEPRVSLAGLGPGKYTFQVVAENGAGQRSDPPASVTFTVQPEFWETWWFRGVLFLILVGAIASVPWMRARRLEREHEELNRLVTERTRDLAERTEGLEREIAGREVAEEERRRLEEQLHQAQKMEAIGRLAGGIAHDFNNLLTAVIGHAQLLEQDLKNGDASAADLEEIQGAARRGASLVSQLLAYSRQQIVRQDLVDMNEVVEASGRLLQRVIGDDVILQVKRSQEPADVRFDRTQLDQVLVNLAVNAKDAMPVGGRLTFEVGQVTLTEASSDLGPDEVHPGSYVTLTVTDTGTGMEQEVLERAFDPFFTTKEVGRGTGLGLATVYGAVHQGDGFVQARSTPGDGTCFTLYFPSAVAERR